MTEHPEMPPLQGPLRIAAVIPCFNEALAIGQVIDEFRASQPMLS